MAGSAWLGIMLPLVLQAVTPPQLTIDVAPDLFPPEALAQKLEGDVPVTLSVSAAGELRCVAKAGNAPALLRRPSCELIVSRNVFFPTVTNGVVTPGAYDLLVRWKLATDNRQFGGAIPIARSRWITYADYPELAGHEMLTGKVDVAFDITEFGRAENCRITRTGATNVLAGAVCPLVLKRAMFLLALTPEGAPRRTRGWLKTLWRWKGECGAKGCGSPDAGA
jgi:hypothetical protein